MEDNTLSDDGLMEAYIADVAAPVLALLDGTRQSIITEANHSTKNLGDLMLKLTK